MSFNIPLTALIRIWLWNSKQKSTCCDQSLQSCVIVPDRLFFKIVSTLRVVIINITWTYLQCKTRIFMQKRLENTKSVVRSCISKKYRQSNDQEKKNKLHNDIQNTTEKTKDLPCNNLGRVWTQVTQNGKLLLLYWWHPSCFSCPTSFRKS